MNGIRPVAELKAGVNGEQEVLFGGVSSNKTSNVLKRVH